MTYKVSSGTLNLCSLTRLMGPRDKGFSTHSHCTPVALWGVTIWAADNCYTRHIAVLGRLLTVVVPRPTQPSIPLGLVNEDQLVLERQGEVWFILFVDKHVGVQVKLWNPSTTRAILERFCSEVPSLRGAISSVSPLPFTFWLASSFLDVLLIHLWMLLSFHHTNNNWPLIVICKGHIEPVRKSRPPSNTMFLMSPKSFYP